MVWQQTFFKSMISSICWKSESFMTSQMDDWKYVWNSLTVMVILKHWFSNSVHEQKKVEVWDLETWLAKLWDILHIESRYPLMWHQDKVCMDAKGPILLVYKVLYMTCWKSIVGDELSAKFDLIHHNHDAGVILSQRLISSAVRINKCWANPWWLVEGKTPETLKGCPQ